MRLALALALGLSLALPVVGQEMPGHHPVPAGPAERVEPPGAQASPGAGTEEVGSPVETTPQEGTRALEAGSDASRRWHTSVEVALSVAVLVFGAAMLWLLTACLAKGYFSSTVFLKLFVLGAVVTAGLFVVVAGYTQDQIAPMMGLLGTLVGYLLGREGNQSEAPAAPGGDSPSAPKTAAGTAPSGAGGARAGAGGSQDG